MSEALAVAETDRPISHQKRSAVGKSAPKRVEGKMRVAIDAMAYEALDYQKAAQKAGLTTRAVRLAFDRPHVVAYYQKQMQVFLTSERSRNLHRAVEIREQDDNLNAALNAAKWLHDPQDTASVRAAASTNVQPGIVVNVSVNASGRTVDETVIEVGPGASTARPSADDGPQHEE